MVCRTCGKKGDHWTSRCPYKDLAQPPESLVDKPLTDGATTAAPATKGAYVPSSLRVGAERPSASMRHRNEENSVRVTNLLEDMKADLHELFRPIGHITRVFPLTKRWLEQREDAASAINKLIVYGYDSPILRVKWATPRAN
ncbi:Eukaryotic translation initiation factor 3 subunit G-B [Bienertia sinuspersici]